MRLEIHFVRLQRSLDRSGVTLSHRARGTSMCGAVGFVWQAPPEIPAAASAEVFLLTA